MEVIEAGPPESSGGRGGRRAGAGRKPNREKYAEQIDRAEAFISGNLTYYAECLDAIAGGRNSGSKETWVAAGTVFVDGTLTWPGTGQAQTDRMGRPLKGRVPAFPHLDPETMVCVQRIVLKEGMDAKANMYLLDRIGGKAAANSNEPPLDSARLDAALAAMEAAVLRPDVPTDVQEAIAQQIKEVGASIIGED